MSSGKYYCFDDKKCKKIPRGYHIGARGYLARDDDNETRKMVTEILTEMGTAGMALEMVMVASWGWVLSGNGGGMGEE